MLLLTDPVRDHADVYNDLPSVEEASAAVREREDFDDVLAEFAALAEQYDLENVVALFLLHRHFTVAPGEIMLESLERLPDGRPALVTMPRAADTFHPTRWALSPDGEAVFRPLEFSTATEARAAASAVAAKKEFLTALSELLERHGLANRLGLAVQARAFPAERGELFVEESTEEASIVTVEPADEAMREDAIETTWAPLRGASGQIECVRLCVCRGFDTPQRHRHSPS